MANELQPIDSRNYLPSKPLSSRRHEYSIRQSLLEQGLPKELADAVIGYTIEDIPFVYRTMPHEVTDGNSGRPMISELWIGTTDAIHNLCGEWNDQIPEIVTQWRGYVRADEKNPKKRVTRTEIHHLSNGSYVELEYENVSEMGQFDGELNSINLHIPGEKFRPWGGPRERQQYGIYGFRRQRIDSGMANVPGGLILRKDKPQHEWTFQLPSGKLSNVIGTTILNGFEEMVNFHMGEIEPLKEDYHTAYRFSALPEPGNIPLLPESIEQEYETRLLGMGNRKGELIESQFERVHNMMLQLAPMVRDFLAGGHYARDVEGMATDGILNHPEKIQILRYRLSDFSREQRFMLAQAVAVAIKDGRFRDWVTKLQGESMDRFVTDTANRNTYHLLNWFMRVAPESADLKEWISNAEKVIYDRAKGKKVETTDEFNRCFDGMCTSFVERFVEALAQQYLGNTLL